MEHRVERPEGGRKADLALTLDDAPSVLPRGAALTHDPRRMDRVREVLLDEGVAHCVAFVTGQAAEGHEAFLSRWLESGYELGNHTHDHPRCSAVSTSSFLESVDRCDRLLDDVGAFEGSRQRWLRFPYLDRGADPTTRAELGRALDDRGYRAACASTDSFDYLYDDLLAEALVSEDSEQARRIRARALRTALDSTRFTLRAARRRFRRPVPLVFLAHFGPVTTLELRHVVRGLEHQGLAITSLADALSDPVHVEYDGDTSRTGLSSDGWVGHGLAMRIRRRFIKLLNRAPFSGLGSCGPVWPHLT